MEFDALPGGDLVRQGLIDLASGVESIESLLVAIGAPRLREGGIEVPERSIHRPEHRLYEMLADADADSAHGRYNALIRRLVSFERSLGCVAR